MSTGTYEGPIENGLYEGKGQYSFPDSKGKYVGHFHLGSFHGEGSMFVKGGYFKGSWEKGRLVNGGFVFTDGLEHSKLGEDKWSYCTAEDPRFYAEIKAGVTKGGPYSHKTANHENFAKVPIGCYDVGDGYFHPKKQSIYSYDKGDELRMVEKVDREWIVEHCRMKDE